MSIMENTIKAVEIWRKKKAHPVICEGNTLAEIYTEEDRLRIVSTIAQKMIEENISMSKAIGLLIESKDIPGVTAESMRVTIFRWGLKNPELKEMLKEARRECANSLVESIQELDQQAITKDLNSVDPKIANAFATLHKTRTANIQWLAERIVPNEYSQKMQIAGKVEHVLVSMNIIVPMNKKEPND